MKKILLLALLLFSVFTAKAGNTYYIDFATGSDANSMAQAKSKTTPWKHHPYMTGWTGTYSHAAADQFIFKGGVTWDNTCFPLANTNDGSAGNVDYFGVDQTWFTGGAWTRPIFNNGGTSATKFIWAGSYWQIDNIEFTGYHWDSGQGVYGSCTYIRTYEASHTTVSNCYFHGWSHGTYASGARDDLNIICGSTAGNTRSNIITGCVFDGTDTDQASGTAVYDESTVRNCTAKNMANGFLVNEAVEEVSGCFIGPIKVSFDTSAHENAIEQNGAASITTTGRFFNNVIHDTYAVTCLFGPANGSGGGWAVYVYNNVVWNSPPIAFQFDARLLSATNTAYVWNNTVDTTGCTALLATTTNSNWGTINFGNTHYIGSGPLFGTLGTTTVNQSNTVTQTLAAANAQGYNSSQTNPYSPTSSSVATYNAGTPDTDTGSTADILGVTRGVGGRWDAGAYQVASGADTTPPTPNPSTGSAIVLSSTAYDVTADLATDAGTPPVQYSVSTDGGSTWSAFQSSQTFHITGKTPATLYHNKVKAEDSAGAPNVTTPSSNIDVTTYATTSGGSSIGGKSTFGGKSTSY